MCNDTDINLLNIYFTINIISFEVIIFFWIISSFTSGSDVSRCSLFLIDSGYFTKKPMRNYHPRLFPCHEWVYWTTCMHIIAVSCLATSSFLITALILLSLSSFQILFYHTLSYMIHKKRWKHGEMGYTTKLYLADIPCFLYAM